MFWRIILAVDGESERGELGRREFHTEGTAGGLKRGLLGMFCGDFSDVGD